MCPSKLGRVVRFVAILAVIFLICSCSCEERDRRLLPLMPLCVGNTWVRSVYGEDRESGELIYQREDTLRIVSVAPLDGEDYFLSNTQLAFRHTSQGLSFARYDEDGFDDLEILLLYPISDGDEYKYLSTKVPQAELLVRMDRESVSTPSGDYYAYTYRIYYPVETLVLTLSFAPGIGLVQMRNAFGTVWLLSSVTLVTDGPYSHQWPPTGIAGS